MNVVDANVLRYAVNEDAAHHEDARRWLDGALIGAETVGFSWLVVFAFVRLSTKAGLFPRPLPVPDALAQVDAWMSAPAAVVVEPTARHLPLLVQLLTRAGTVGDLVNDPHLAALAIEHRGAVVTYDRDFDRFPGLEWRRP